MQICFGVSHNDTYLLIVLYLMVSFVEALIQIPSKNSAVVSRKYYIYVFIVVPGISVYDTNIVHYIQVNMYLACSSAASNSASSDLSCSRRSPRPSL